MFFHYLSHESKSKKKWDADFLSNFQLKTQIHFFSKKNGNSAVLKLS